MRFKIFGKKTKQTIVYFKLMQNDDDSPIRLIACDENGEPIPGGNILEILTDGSLFRNGGITLDIGLRLDDRGMIWLSQKYE